MDFLFQNITSYFSWDWPWLVVALMVSCVFLFHASLLSDFNNLPGRNLIFIAVFLLIFLIPFSMPFMAWFAGDFWVPIFILSLISVYFFQSIKSDGALALIWHFLGFFSMTPLSIIIRAIRYFDNS